MVDVPGSGSRLSRRRLLGTASAVVGGVALSGCARTGAQPSPLNTAVTVTFEPWWLGIGTPKRSFQLYQEVFTSFEAANKGIRIQLIDFYGVGGTAQNLSAALAGAGADILYDTAYSSYVDNNILLPLDGYLERDGISRSIWSAGQVAMLQTAAGMFGLPAYMSPQVYAARLDLFDTMGIAYPDPGWTYDVFTETCRKLTVSAPTQPQFGACMQWHRGGIGAGSWLFSGFGGSQTNATRTASTLSTPQDVQAGQWMYEQMLWPKIGITSGEYGGPQSAFLNGKAGLSIMGTWNILPVAEAVGDQFKWAFVPVPVYPAGAKTFGNADFYGVNVQCRHPDQAWQVLKWVCAEPTWQKAMMTIALLSPGLNSLWPEWEKTVISVAPLFSGKGLHYFTEAAVNGDGVPPAYYAYDNSQVSGAIAPYFQQLWNQTTTVADAWAGIDKGVNAILSQGLAGQQAQVALLNELSSAAQAKGPVNFPAPSVNGAGSAPTSGASVVRTGTAGQWVLIGDGAGVSASSDNCSFAGVAWTSDQGTFTCRVASIENVTCPHLSPDLAVGLMARGDLSSDAADMVVAVTGSDGVLVARRWMAGETPLTMSAPAKGSQTGLISPGFLTGDLLSTSQPGVNLLLRPVWLRLVRTASGWQAYTSLDGSTWTPAGERLQAMMAGCWVGLFATAHNADFNGKGTIRATFSHVNFTPKQLSQIGSA